MSEFDNLLVGYHRFRADNYPRQRERYDLLAQQGQSPQTLIIACSDSRVDPSQIFDVDPGQIFVVRNVAALVPPFETTPGLHGVSAALEFAVQVLKVRQIVVMGHGMCGGARAALTQELRGAPPGEGGFISSWIGLLDDVRGPVAEKYGTESREAERAMEYAAVQISLRNLRSFPCIRQKERDGDIKLHGTFFAISDGVLHILDETTGGFYPAD